MKNKSCLRVINFLIVIVVLHLIFSFIELKFSLIGKWSILDLNGSPVGEYITFDQDDSYSISTGQGKIGERGTYMLTDSLFSIKNDKDACGKGYWGKYNLTFYGKDSVHFTLLDDTCLERKMDIVGYNPGLKRYHGR